MEFRLPGVPVFVYHGVADEPRGLTHRERKYWVSRHELASQLRAVRAGGFLSCALEEFWTCTRDTNDRRRVVVTFDDGNSSDYDVAFPLLMEHRIPAAFFLNTATIGKTGFLTWPEIAEMQRAGMSFQSHAHDHVYLSRLEPDRAKAQMARSKAILEDRLGRAVSFIAAPYGDFNRRVLGLAQDLGYRALCTGRSLPAKVSRGRIDRTVIYANMSDRRFRAFLRRSPLAYADRALRACAKQVPKRVWVHLRQQEVSIP
jgi:peptidoglycan/xylan/chitin deacetylase (PgdA/CDA1 family)